MEDIIKEIARGCYELHTRRKLKLLNFPSIEIYGIKYLSNGKHAGYKINGRKTGQCNMFYEDGKIHIESYYINGIENGTTIIYSSENGNIIRKIDIFRGKINGLDIGFNFDGSLSFKIEFLNGVKHGLSERYIDGNIVAKSHYVDGKFHGTRESYHWKDGYLWKSENYVHGEKTKSTLFDKDGNITDIEMFNEFSIVF